MKCSSYLEHRMNVTVDAEINDRRINVRACVQRQFLLVECQHLHGRHVLGHTLWRRTEARGVVGHCCCVVAKRVVAHT